MKNHIEKIRDKIEQGHCKGSAARDKNGNAVNCNDPLAVSWCLLGAIGCCVPWDEQRGVFKLIESAIGSNYISGYSDKHSKDEVISMLNGLIND